MAFEHQVKRYLFIPAFGLLSVLLLAGVAVKVFELRYAARNHIGALHTFQLSESPDFLREDLALAKASEAMTLDGFDILTWRPVQESNSTSPDGRRDHYLRRGFSTPSSGFVTFTNGNARPRWVHVELNGNEVTCRGRSSRI